MRRAAALAALALLWGCSMPPVPDGFQLVCAADGDCLDGTVCSMGCCVKPGEAPTCSAANGIGTGCTGGGAPLPDGGASPGTCPATLACFNEAQTGLVGGLCSQPCSSAHGCGPGESDCVEVSRLGLPWSNLCLRRCVARSGPSSDCRPGWGCDCGGDAGCHCLPRCAASGPGACAAGPDGGAMTCNAQSGVCEPAPAGPDAGADAGSGGFDAGAVDAGAVDAGPDAGPADGGGASAWWTPPIPVASGYGNCDALCGAFGAACSESCGLPGGSQTCGAAALAGGTYSAQTCSSGWSATADAGHFLCCCGALHTWTTDCAAATAQVGSCTELCASRGQACDEGCEASGPQDVAGARAWAPGAGCGGQPAGYASCGHPWGDDAGSPARWSCCCL